MSSATTPQSSASSIAEHQDDSTTTTQNNTYPLLTQRLTAWKAIVKTLSNYFHQIADAQEATAKAYAKAATVLVSPENQSGGHFITSDKPGVLKLIQDMHTLTRTFATTEAGCRNTISDSVVQTLHKLKSEIKHRQKSLLNESKARSGHLEKEREATRKEILNLGGAIQATRIAPGVDAADPWLANHAVRVQLQHELQTEKSMHAVQVAALDSYRNFEQQTIVQTLRRVLTIFSNQYGTQGVKAPTDIQTSITAFDQSIESFVDDAEWSAFLEMQKDRLVDPTARIPGMEEVNYEHKDEPICKTIRQGSLERKKFAGWTKGIYVLTEAGWLHSFPTSDLLSHASPQKSIYVSGSFLHPPHAAGSDHPQEFSVMEKGKGGAFHKNEHRYRFRATTTDDAVHWWNSLASFANIGVEQNSASTLGRAGSVMGSRSRKNTEEGSSGLSSPVESDVEKSKVSDEPEHVEESTAALASTPSEAAAAAPATEEPTTGATDKLVV